MPTSVRTPRWNSSPKRTSEPTPFQTRKTVQVQTEWEPLIERPFEVDMGVQTETSATDDYINLLTQHPDYHMLPVISSFTREIATQVDEGELVDFDAEVEPILEELAGQAIYDAVEDLQQEQELEKLVQRRVSQKVLPILVH